MKKKIVILIQIIFMLTVALHCTAGCKSKSSSRSEGKHYTKLRQENHRKVKPHHHNQNLIVTEHPIWKTDANLEVNIRRDTPGEGTYPSLVITQSVFLPAPDGSGKNTRPGPARFIILRKKPNFWEKIVVDDPDSNVFHKAQIFQGGILTAGATGAYLKIWRFLKGNWKQEVLWNPHFGGKFDRLRDFEIGKVMDSGQNHIVVATHDQGVIAVVWKSGPRWKVKQIMRQKDTFIHEIELGDFDGDGIDEIFATPSQPNRFGVSQPGSIIEFRWNGKDFVKSVVKKFERRHVKEILVTRLNGRKKPVLFGVVEAELEKLGGKNRIAKPVEIIEFNYDEGSRKFRGKTIASIQDAQCRFLLSGDVNSDGKTELIAAAMTSGLWLIREISNDNWEISSIDPDSSGYEHSCHIADMDGNTVPEIYVAGDDQKALNRYEWDGKKFVKTKIMDLTGSVITWNVTAGNF